MNTYCVIKMSTKIKTSTSGGYMPMLQNNTDMMHEKQWLGTMARLHSIVIAVVNIITTAIKQHKSNQQSD